MIPPLKATVNKCEVNMIHVLPFFSLKKVLEDKNEFFKKIDMFYNVF